MSSDLKSLFAKPRVRPEVVGIEGLEGLHLRIMTGQERVSFLDSVGQGHPQDQILALLARCLCDEQGVRVWETETPEDLVAISKMDAVALDEMVDRAMKMNRLGTKDKEEVRKNSEGHLDSSTGSQTAGA